MNRFVVENRRQVARYQALSQTLEETNRQLRRAEADARRSERLAALGQMSAGLAHEIRNPLGVIKGSAEMLVQKLKDAQPLASELAGYISSEVNRINALVARFLDFARPSNLDLRPVQIAGILDRALESVQTQLPDVKVRVERHYAAGVPDILVDEQLCESVFANLIQNAYQAMERRRRRRRRARPAPLRRAGNFQRQIGRPRHGGRHRPGRAGRNARADIQPVLHVEKRRRGTWPGNRRQDRGRPSRLDQTRRQFLARRAISCISPELAGMKRANARRVTATVRPASNRLRL